MGIGIGYGMVMFEGIAWESMGPGTLISNTCSYVSLFVVSGTHDTHTHTVKH